MSLSLVKRLGAAACLEQGHKGGAITVLSIHARPICRPSSGAWPGPSPAGPCPPWYGAAKVPHGPRLVRRYLGH